MRRHVVRLLWLAGLLVANAPGILAADPDKPSPAVLKVLAYLDRHKEKHTLDDPARQLSAGSEQQQCGGVEIRLYQVHEGVMVRGTLIYASVWPGGTVEIRVLKTRKIEIKTTTPSVSREKAYVIAVNDLKPAGGVSLDTSGTYLEIIPKGINDRVTDTLVWTVAVSVENDVETGLWSYTINAADGSIIDHSKVMPLSMWAPMPRTHPVSLASAR